MYFRSGERIYRNASYRHCVCIFNRLSVVKRISQCVDYSSYQLVADSYVQFVAGVVNYTAGTYALKVGIRHKQYLMLVESHHFGRDMRLHILCVDTAHIAYTAQRSARLDCHSDYLFNFTQILICIGSSEFCQKSAEIHVKVLSNKGVIRFVLRRRHCRFLPLPQFPPAYRPFSLTALCGTFLCPAPLSS